MDLQTEIRGDALFVTVTEKRIDAAVAIQFKDKMRDVAENGPVRVVLDLCNVDFIDSSGLGAIVGTMKLLGKDRRFELAGLTPNVDKVFHLTRMDTVFTIHRSAHSAVAEISNAS
jgi:anti-sigma B factor antagonist